MTWGYSEDFRDGDIGEKELAAPAHLWLEADLDMEILQLFPLTSRSRFKYLLHVIELQKMIHFVRVKANLYGGSASEHDDKTRFVLLIWHFSKKKSR